MDVKRLLALPTLSKRKTSGLITGEAQLSYTHSKVLTVEHGNNAELSVTGLFNYCHPLASDMLLVYNMYRRCCIFSYVTKIMMIV